MAIKNEEILAALDRLHKDPNDNIVMNTLAASSSSDFKDNFIFVYGSLRKDEYNYHKVRSIFGAKNFMFIKNLDLNYFKLFDLGDYPAVTRGSFTNVVRGDIMYCSDKVFKAIYNIEIEAGYKIEETSIFEYLDTGKQRYFPIKLFVADKKLTSDIINSPLLIPRVESGDWSKYLRSVVKG